MSSNKTPQGSASNTQHPAMSSNNNSQDSTNSTNTQRRTHDYLLEGIGSWCSNESVQTSPPNASGVQGQNEVVAEHVREKGDTYTVPVTERLANGIDNSTGK